MAVSELRERKVQEEAPRFTPGDGEEARGVGGRPADPRTAHEGPSGNVGFVGILLRSLGFRVQGVQSAGV